MRTMAVLLAALLAVSAVSGDSLSLAFTNVFAKVLKCSSVHNAAQGCMWSVVEMRPSYFIRLVEACCKSVALIQYARACEDIDRASGGACFAAAMRQAWKCFWLYSLQLCTHT